MPTLYRTSRRPEKRPARTLLGEFSGRLGNETLSIRIYHDRDSFVCERQLVQCDGSSFTLVLPFRAPDAALALLAADPYYPQVRGQLERVLVRLDQAFRGAHGKPAN